MTDLERRRLRHSLRKLYRVSRERVPHAFALELATGGVLGGLYAALLGALFGDGALWSWTYMLGLMFLVLPASKLGPIAAYVHMRRKEARRSRRRALESGRQEP